MNFNLEHFCNSVFRHRNIELKISRKKAANESKMNQNTIRDIETGNVSTPSIQTVILACNWMKKDIKEFI